ncbi:MAG: HipA family kinase [Planctomycetota bacterium]
MGNAKEEDDVRGSGAASSGPADGPEAAASGPPVSAPLEDEATAAPPATLPAAAVHEFEVVQVSSASPGGSSGSLLGRVREVDGGRELAVILKFRKASGKTGETRTSHLLAELVIARLLTLLGLQVAECGVAELTSDALVGVPTSPLKARLLSELGPIFWVQRLDGYADWFDTPSAKIGPGDRDALTASVLADSCVLNADRLRNNPNIMWNGTPGSVTLVDHGLAFWAFLETQPAWQSPYLVEERLVRAHAAHGVAASSQEDGYDGVRDLWRDVVTPAWVATVLAGVPAEWIADPKHLTLAEQLLNDRDSTIEDVIRNVRSTFGAP